MEKVLVHVAAAAVVEVELAAAVDQTDSTTAVARQKIRQKN